MEQTFEQSSLDRDRRRLLKFAIVVTIILVTAVLVFSLRYGAWLQFLSAVSVGLLVAGAFFFAGMLLGFLFGIPRTVQGQEPGTIAEDQDQKPAQGITPAQDNPQVGTLSLKPKYRVNTNLEQISDWLTKMLVGIGLIQINGIWGKLRQLSIDLSSAFPSHELSAGGFALAVAVYSSVFGFFMGYLWTRVVLSPLFRIADLGLIGAIEVAREKVRQANEISQSAAELAKTQQEMVMSLYRYEDKGFLNAIDIATTFLNREKKSPDDTLFWIRLACAYAQKYTWLQDQKSSQDKINKTKQKIFECLDRAVLIDRLGAGQWIWSLSDPEYPYKSKDENDLEDLRDDEEFKSKYGALIEEVKKKK